MPVELCTPDVAAAQPAVLFMGRKARLRAADARTLVPAAALPLLESMLDDASPGDRGTTVHTYVPDAEGPRRFSLGVLPEPCSRHNSPARPHAITNLATTLGPRQGKLGIVLLLEDPGHAVAAVAAVARAFPSYCARSRMPAHQPVRVAVVGPGGEPLSTEALPIVANAVTEAAALADMPTSELDVPAFVERAKELAARCPGVTIEVISGEALGRRGLGGLYSVGKAASGPPALVVLGWPGAGPASPSVAWVGKGIVYDTGGLSLKAKTGMPGMKGDMAGAAAVLAAFEAAVKLRTPTRLSALLCLAENAVGPLATRPDDIIRLYSGKTVEVNNTDAEGRLVLADGVAYAARHLSPDTIIDIATLTGAQLVATGKRHAAAISNDEALEARAVLAGRRTGDLVHALPYCPEFYRAEFKSEVADMKNSVKNRENAQSSCAAQFIANHLGDFSGAWLHLDIAGPATMLPERASGFGVALLLDLLGAV